MRLRVIPMYHMYILEPVSRGPVVMDGVESLSSWRAPTRAEHRCLSGHEMSAWMCFGQR